MIEIRHVLCPLDLSETSPATFGYATMLARWYGASVTALQMIRVGLPTVQPVSSPLVMTPEHEKRFTDDLQQFVDAHTPAGLAVNVVLREGPMVEGILEEARSRRADLIVMGTHGRGGFDRLVLGSVTEKVLRKATGPVLTVPPAVTSAPDGAIAPFKNILCAIDFSPASLRALTYALSLAQESGKRLILLHVFDWPVDRPMPGGLGPELAEYRRHSQEQAERELHAAVPEAARAWCECTEVTAVGRPHETITRIARERGADLIVLGVHGRNAVELALFGSTTHQVVRHATCPVLTIRP